MTILICIALKFLSTLSLRRATHQSRAVSHQKAHFYPRSPCGERPVCLKLLATLLPISIHALLAESDRKINTRGSVKMISIHALLAESDLRVLEVTRNAITDFYPRSPCGERLSMMLSMGAILILFLSTLSLRRATDWASVITAMTSISIHALLAESDACITTTTTCTVSFLSTLSLRRATASPGF